MNFRKLFSKLPTIYSENYVLREITEKDAADYGKCISAPETYKYWGYEMSPEEKDVFGKISYNRLALSKLSEITWGIAERKTDRIIGEIIACRFDGTRKNPRSIAEIGYRIAPEMWGKGAAAEAVGALVKFLFENTKINRIQAVVMKDNPASKRVLEKNGFVTEGLVRQGKVYQVITDYYIMSVLRDDRTL